MILLPRFAAPAALALLASVELCFAQLGIPHDAPGFDIGLPPAPRPVDPTVDQDYRCFGSGYYPWSDPVNGGIVDGDVYWPRRCIESGPVGVHPLVVIVHGDGHDYTDYDYLCRHLALNGFIVATMDGGEDVSNVTKAGKVLGYLGFLRTQWEYAASIENNIALIGHSRGGEGVLTCARKVLEGGLTHDLNALISLAPTDNDELGNEGRESLTGEEVESLLVIYGSADEDVTGYCLQGPGGCGQPAAQVLHTPFSLYDRAGSEGHTEPSLVFHYTVAKSMLFVDDANHAAWRQINGLCPNNANPSSLPCEPVHRVAKGYMNAFLRWRLFGQNVYKRFFTGEWTPEAVEADHLRIRTQFSNGPHRRVIDNFEQSPWQVGTLSTVSAEAQVIVLKEGSVFDHPNHTSPHETNALVLQWSTLPQLLDPWIRWTIPDGLTSIGRRWRDVTTFTHLSFRVGQMIESPLNQGSLNFFVRLRDADGNWSQEVPIDAFTAIAYPDDGFFVNAQVQAYAPKSGMETVRIPLSVFQGIDKHDVTDVEFRFDADLSGEIVLDNLEYTR